MPVSSETRAMVLLASEICEDKKATDTRILELDPVDAGFTDFFLITSGNNTRQTGAIADEIELRMKHDFGTYAKSVEGRRQGEWILLDYIDFVVHIFTEQTREFYDIERLRKSARSVDTHELAAELNRKTEAARKKAPEKKSAKALAKHEGAGESTALARRDTQSALSEKRPPAEKKATKKALAKKAPAKKAPAKKAAAKKAAAKEAPTKKAPAKKAAKKAPAKKSARQASAVEDTSLRALPSGAPDTPPKRLPASTSNK